ncbi:MAG: hypothetical protein HOO06_03945 [Bdellovibrionaceae bacterium]|nr:hypothetical protein [Pseudobdellovibrionaceae bacterium]
MFKKLSITLIVLLISNLCFAKKFRNSYISFDLPSNWDCKLEGTESVCFSKFNKKSKEAIIILTAKEAGPNDHLNYFYTYLKKPRTIPNRKNVPIMSKVVHVKQRQIQNHNWIDALHMSSEVESYYTRYLSTIKGRLAILVTFSAHKKFYTRYSMDFLNAIKSLKVVASKSLLTQRTQQPTHKQAPMGQNISISQLEVGEDEFSNSSKNKSGGKTEKIIALVLIIGSVVLFLLTRKKKSKKKKR